MKKLTKEEELYVQQMNLWIEEQDEYGAQLERTAVYYEKMAENNKEQLRLHNERVNMGKAEFEAWKKEHDLD